MTVASAAAHSAARVLAALVALTALMLVGIVSCDPAAARGHHGAKPRPHQRGSFCAPVIMQGAGMVRICGIPAAARP